MATERIESLISKEALAQFDELNSKLGISITGFEKLVAKAVETNKALGGAKTFKQVIDGTKELEKAEVDLAKSKSELQKQQEKLNKLYTDEAKKLAELKLQQQQRSAQIKNTIKEEQAAKGSIEQRKAALQRLQKEYDNLSAKERESSRGQRLEKTVAGITDQLKQLEGATGNFRRNVGNYSGSAKIIVEALEKARQKFDGLRKAADTTPAALERAKSEFESLRKITDNKQFLNFGGKMGDATAEVRTFTRTLVNLESQGLGNSEVAADLRKRLAELTDTIADTRAEVKALASDTRAFDLFASSISFAADVFQTAAGAAVAFGASEEDAAEATKTLLAIQNISNGVKGIANELTTKGTAANKAYTFAQRQLSIAFDSSAAAGARFRAVLVTLGIGAIVVGIGLLVANFDKIKRAITGATKEQEAYNKLLAESSSEYTSAVKLVNTLKINIDLAKKGFIDKEVVLKEYNDTLGKSAGSVKNLDEAEKQLIEKGDAYIKMTLAKAVANLALEEASKKAFEAEVKRRKDAEEFLTAGDKLKGFGAGNVSAPGFVPNLQTQATQAQIKFEKEQSEKRKAAAIKVSTDEEKFYLDISKNSQKLAAEIAQKAGLKIIPTGDPQKKTLNKKFNDSALKAEADQFKKLSEIEEAYAITRLSAREKNFELETQILQGHRRADILNAQGDKDKLLEIEKDFADKQKALQLSLDSDLFLIRQSSIAQQRKLEEEAMKLFQEEQEKSKIDQLAAEERAFQKRQHYLEENRDILLKSLQEERNAKIAAAQSDAERVAIEQEYANKRKQIELQTNIDIINAAIDVAQKKLKLAQDPELVAALEAQLADLKKQLSELKGATIDLNIQTAQEKVDTLVQKIQGISDKLLTGFQAVSDIVNLNAERDIEAINEEIKAIEDRSAKEIALTNAEAISKEEKAKKIALIEARTQAQREQLERRQRSIELQRARFEKAVTIGRIIADTAAAVVAALGMKPYTPANIALAAVTGAIGAVQLAKAIATPLPKFATGTDDAPGGLAVVGDGFRKELVVTPEGKLIETPAVPTVMNVPKHSIVMPDAEQAIRAMNAHLAQSTVPMSVDNGRHYREMTATLGGKLDKLEKTIRNKREVHIRRTRDGWEKITKSGGNETNYLNRNLQG